LETVSDRLVSCAIALALTLSACAHKSPELTLSAAASLHPAVTEAAAKFNGARVVCNLGGSGSLANQIVNGAPADVFISAGPKPMDDLAGRGLLLDGTRRDLLRNDIVLITTGATGCFDSLAGPDVKHVSIGEPDSVPAGDYARQVLTHLGVWDQLRPKLVFAQDVRQVLSHVASGNADAGIVYATDARTEPKVRVVCAAPPGSHQPVVYPIAVMKNTHDAAAARALAAFLAGPEARAIFQAHGFTVAAP
jgi:molybdate transport system substrate-binding protein